MHLLLYSGRKKGPGKKLQDVIETVVRKNQLEIHRDTNSLCSSLRRTMRRQCIVVLFAETGEDFSDFFSIQELLMDLSIIFIVPDRAPDTLSKAHRFFPRYVTSTEYDFDDVKMVLERMIQNLEGRHSQGPAELIGKGFKIARGQKLDVVIG